MNDRGFAGFLLPKVGLLMASIFLIGAAMSMISIFEGQSERAELVNISKGVERVLRLADHVQHDFVLEQKLPLARGTFDLKIKGYVAEGMQIVQITAEGEEEISRTVILAKKINGGYFLIERPNPTQIRLYKIGETYLELV